MPACGKWLGRDVSALKQTNDPFESALEMIHGLVTDDKLCPPLYLIRCRHCGVRYWHLWDVGEIAGGPCCFGHEVLDYERYPNETMAVDAWSMWVDRQQAVHRA